MSDLAISKVEPTKSTPLPISSRHTFVDVKRAPKLRPKQALFLKLYYTPSSDTFGNIYQSGVKAGFAKSYSRVLTVQANDLQWLKEGRAYLSQLEPQHIRNVLEEEMLHSAQSRDRIRAAELLGKDTGMFIDRSETNVNVSFTNHIPRPTVIEQQD